MRLLVTVLSIETVFVHFATMIQCNEKYLRILTPSHIADFFNGYLAHGTTT